MSQNLMESSRPSGAFRAVAALFLALASTASGCTGIGSPPREPGEPVSGTAGSGPKPGGRATPVISGPFAHENLAVYLVRGPDRLAGRKLLGLDDALRDRKVVVHETEAVNRLAIENVSDDAIFVQAGDIVKGGRQDRALAVDLVVPPHSGKVAVDAFCVEHGRWSRRGAEPVRQFSGSSGALATKELKLAARQHKRQHDVWAEVDAAQRKLREKAGAAAVDGASPSSMQLTMEAPAVKARIEPYLEKLSKLPDAATDVIGCAFAVNGRLTSADLYASPSLFRALWPKLLRAGAVEALAETGATPEGWPRIDTVQAFVSDSPSGKRAEEEIGGRMKLLTVERDDAVLFDSRDVEQKAGWIRRSVVSKESSPQSRGEL